MAAKKKRFDSWKNWTIRNKLISAFILLSLVPLLVLGSYAYIYMYHSMMERVQSDTLESIRQIAAQIESRFQNDEQVIHYLMYNSQLSSIFGNTAPSYYDIYYAMEEVYEPLILSVHEMNQHFNALGVLTTNRAYRSRGSELIQLGDADADYVLPTDHRIRWYFGADENVIGIGRMMRTSRTAPLNYVYLSTPARLAFSAAFESTERYRLLVFEQQQMLYEIHNSDTAGPEVNWMDYENGFHSIQGVRYLSIRAPVAQTPWSLVFCCPVSSLNININPLLYMTFVALCVALVTLVLVSLAISRAITRPIRALNHSMAKVEQGELTGIQPKIYAQDELGELTRHYIFMVNALQQYIETNYRNRITLRDAEMKALQSQINPHFLYNTLSMMNWIAIEKNEDEISNSLMLLSKFYRMVLNHGDFRVTVRQEIQHVECYLALQNLLHDSKLQTRIDIDERMLDYPMIGIILQPIVENAIEHGLNHLRDRPPCLSIVGYLHQNLMEFHVQDNGMGMTMECFQNSIVHSAKGYGLKNVQERLRIVYGTQAGLRLAEGNEIGTEIVITIPILMEDGGLET